MVEKLVTFQVCEVIYSLEKGLQKISGEFLQMLSLWRIAVH